MFLSINSPIVFGSDKLSAKEKGAVLKGFAD